MREELDIPLAAALFWNDEEDGEEEWMIEVTDRSGRLRLLLPYRSAAIAHTAHRLGTSYEHAEHVFGDRVTDPPVRFARPLRVIQGG